MTTSELDDLRSARANYSRQLKELSDPAKRKPRSSVAGRSVSWGEYHKLLLEMVLSLNRVLADEGDDQPDGGYILTAAE